MQNQTEEKNEKAVIIGIDLNRDRDTVRNHLNELEALLETLGISTAEKVIAPLKKTHAPFLVGKGKVDDIKNIALESESSYIVFDDSLSPSQQRNWEKYTGIRTSDRQEIIISIFSERAVTREASLQVELARLSYALPRLTGAWTHLSKQRGGVSGNRGEGEKQLELDRRIVLNRISRLKNELETVEKQRSTRRKQRSINNLPSCSIAGYTNAGKSTLLNRLTLSDVDANDRVFDTLDPSTRKMKLPGGKEILLTDTVGFIRKLPHQLIEAFKSTLEETALSDIIVLVMDGSDPEVLSHYRASVEVLDEIGASEKTVLQVFNKIDKDTDPFLLHRLENDFENAVFISARTGKNIDKLLKKIEELINQGQKTMQMKIPLSKYNIISLIKSSGTVIEEKYIDNHVIIKATLPGSIAGKLDQYSIENPL